MPNATSILGVTVTIVSVVLLLVPVALATTSVVSRRTERVRALARAHFLATLPVATIAFAVGAGRLVFTLLIAATISAIVARVPAYRVVHRVRHTLP